MSDTKSNSKGKIHTLMIAVMRDVEAIGKDRQADQYKFRGIDDVYNALHATFSKHGIFVMQEVLEAERYERTSQKGNTLAFTQVKVRYTLLAEDGSSVESVMMGEGMDRGDKSMAKALSMAQKYLFLQAFMIPTVEVKDAEADTFELADKDVASRTPGGTVSDEDLSADDKKIARVNELADGIREHTDLTPTQVKRSITKYKDNLDDLISKMDAELARLEGGETQEAI